AMRDDQARPQIAQITELGLVELTRKRQGQNIYELFGRACPSCGGLGHVVTLPGKDTLQPLASLPGLVRSAASARAEVSSPSNGDGGGGRRRRRGGGRAATEPVDQVDSDQELSGSGAQAGAEPRRQDPQVVAVPMDADQELVFGWLGLNPALLADPAPEDLDNVVSRVVRPGDDADAVMEAAKQELAASGGRRRRRGGRGSGNGPVAAAEEASGSIPVEITPLLDPEPTAAEPALVEIAPLVVSTPQSEPAEPVAAPEAEASAEPEAESEGEGRRRRRRRSAG
ncbi:MAG: ribonuclease E, partial [Synechococcus sp.]